jgi:hypothetical protein
MKYIYKIVLLSFLIIGITSCDKNENFEILTPQGGITINSPIDGSTVVLNKTNPGNPGLTISWSSSNLEGTGVTYSVEVALLGTDFTIPFVIGTTEATSINFTVEELNTLALDILEIPGDTEAGIDIRVYAGDEVSQKISVLLTPFSIEYTELYLIGSLTDWEPAKGLPFTRLGFNEFEITVNLADGDAFKFIPQTDKGWDGAWKEDPNNPGTLIDEIGDPNISGYPAGKYKIYVNLNTFTFTVENAMLRNLFLVGDATEAGWNENNNNTPMFRSSENQDIYSITGKFRVGGFKFLEIKGQWPPLWGTNDGTTLTYRPTDADPDPGTLSIGAEGYYKVYVNLTEASFSITPYIETGKTIFATIGVIGDATNKADLNANGTHDGWESDMDMIQSTFDNHIWHINGITLEDGGMKFRADNDWNDNWGDNGGNISVSAGTYDIWFNDLTGEYLLIPIL